MELVYIGEQHAMNLPGLIKPFQDRVTGKQFDWVDVSDMALKGGVYLRPATPDEMAALEKHFGLITASLTYLSQFMDGEPQ